MNPEEYMDLFEADPSWSEPAKRMWSLLRRNGQGAAIVQAIQDGADPLAANKNGVTALFLAVAEGDKEGVGALIDAGAMRLDAKGGCQELAYARRTLDAGALGRFMSERHGRALAVAERASMEEAAGEARARAKAPRV